MSNWFYIICSKFLNKQILMDDNKLKLIEILNDVKENKIQIIDKLSEELERDIKEDKRSYRITNLLSDPKENIESKENRLIMKIWFLVLFYTEDKLDKITPFY